MDRFAAGALFEGLSSVVLSGEVICEEPLLTIDRQIGVNVVHPEGRVRSIASSLGFSSLTLRTEQDSKTIFNRMSYHEASNTSVVHCAFACVCPLPSLAAR